MKPLQTRIRSDARALHDGSNARGVSPSHLIDVVVDSTRDMLSPTMPSQSSQRSQELPVSLAVMQRFHKSGQR